MTARKRKSNESFKEYRANLKKENQVEKNQAKGRLIWNSSRNGTFVRPR